MTQQEALALNDGDYVEALLGRRWRLACVDFGPYPDAPRTAAWQGYIYVRRLGRTAKGRRYPRVFCWLKDARKTEYRPEPANVFADWLDDNGHPEAAKALREAFPLGDRTP